MKVYFDVCCFSRPFDCQNDNKIHIETEAILLLMTWCMANELLIITSEVIELEINKITNLEKRLKVLVLASVAKERIIIDKKVEERACELQKICGFDPYDALHIACAEKGKAGIFFTTDEKLLKKTLKFSKIIKVQVVNPVIWIITQGSVK